MPALSPTMTEGVVARWCKAEGESFRSGDILAEIETDKATMELEAADDGVLGRQLAPEGGAPVAVGAAIALVLEEGEDAAAWTKPTWTKPPWMKRRLPPPPPPPSMRRLRAAAPGPAPGPPPPQPAPGARLRPAPWPRRLATEAGLALAGIPRNRPRGTDHRRRHPPCCRCGSSQTRRRRWHGCAQELRLASRPGLWTEALERPFELQPALQCPPHQSPRDSPSPSAKCRTTTSPATAASDSLLALRGNAQRLRARGGGRARQRGSSPSTTSSCGATALALRDQPRSNCSFDESGLVFWQTVDLAFAVATEDGLFTPVLREADQLALPELSSAVRSLAAKARAGRLKPQEYLGGSFAVSNLGMFGVSDFAAVINPPQAGILAVGAAERRVFPLEGGGSENGWALRLTLSMDHRAVDGAAGAELLASIAGYLEAPLLLALPEPAKSGENGVREEAGAGAGAGRGAKAQAGRSGGEG